MCFNRVKENILETSLSLCIHKTGLSLCIHKTGLSLCIHKTGLSPCIHRMHLPDKNYGKRTESSTRKLWYHKLKFIIQNLCLLTITGPRNLMLFTRNKDTAEFIQKFIQYLGPFVQGSDCFRLQNSWSFCYAFQNRQSSAPPAMFFQNRDKEPSA